MADIFKCKDEMPSKTVNDNCAVALTPAEVRANGRPASIGDSYMDVKNVTRPRYGHGY